MGISHPKIKTRESLSGHPKNMFLQNKGFEENPGGKVDPCPQENLRGGSFLEKVFVLKNDT